MVNKKLLLLIITLGLRVFNAAGQLALTWFLLKAFGKSTTGIFTVFVSNTMLTSLLLRQGFDRTLVLVGVKNKLSRLADPLFGLFAKKILVVSPFIGLINLAMFYFTSGVPETKQLAVIVFALPILFACSFLVAGYFTGAGKTVSATLQQPGFSAGITAIILIVTYKETLSQNIYLTYVLVVFSVTLYGLLRVFINKPVNKTQRSVPVNLKPLIIKKTRAYSARYLIINFFTTFSSVYFISYLALFVSDSTIGEFKVVERLAMVISFNLSFINVILPSKSINKYNSNNMDGFAKSVQDTLMFQYITAIAVFLPLVLFGDYVMEYLEVDNPKLYYFLLFAQLINALTGPVRIFLMYMGGQNILLLSAVLETIGSMILYWLLFNWGGSTGLAYAYFIAISTPNLILSWVVYKRFGIIPLPFTKQSLLQKHSYESI